MSGKLSRRKKVDPSPSETRELESDDENNLVVLSTVKRTASKSFVPPHEEGTSYWLSRWFFLKWLSLVYIFAFSSWVSQIPGLYGPHGIAPVQVFLQTNRGTSNWESFTRTPTILWWSQDLGFREDAMMQACCILGIILGITALLGLLNSVVFLLMWFLYLSIFQVGQTFSAFQWDILLLETGFIAILYAPFMSLQKYSWKEQPSPMIRWLLRWLLFRLMFSSGVVKLLSNDSVWWQLRALDYHYETQCIPNPIAWYAHQLPPFVHKASVAIMFFIEILLPWTVFTPTKFLRNLNAFTQIALQLVIIATGNYNFFNFLTITISLGLIDDSTLRLFIPPKKQELFDPDHKSPIVVKENSWNILTNLMTVSMLALLGWIAIDVSYFGMYHTWDISGLGKFLNWTVPLSILLGIFYTTVYSVQHFWGLRKLRIHSRKWTVIAILKGLLLLPITMIIFYSSLVPYTARIHRSTQVVLPSIVKEVYHHPYLQPYQITSSYGLFARMTTNRDEIIIEGSNDGVEWLTYEFQFKPGDVNRAPPFVAPLQPRLDWQMWFAALGSYQHNPWYIGLIGRLLEGSKSVNRLLAKNPFPTPPKMIRSSFYNYHFTDFESGKNGSWWQRTYKGLYMDIVTKDNPQLQVFMTQLGVGKSTRKDLIRSFAFGDIPNYVIILSCILFLFVSYLTRDRNEPLPPPPSSESSQLSSNAQIQGDDLQVSFITKKTK